MTHWKVFSVFFASLVCMLVLSALPVSAQDTPVATPVNEAEDVAGDIVEFTEETSQATVNTLTDFVNRLTQPPTSQLARVLLIIGGLVLLVVGWRVYDWVIVIAGFLLGALAAAALFPGEDTVILLLVMLVGGLIGAALGSIGYYISVLLIGAYIGIVLTNGLAGLLGLAPVSPLVLLIGAVIGAAILLGLSFELVVVVSAIVGAQMLSAGLGLTFGWTLLLAVIGVIVQLIATRSFGYALRRPLRRRWFTRRAV